MTDVAVSPGADGTTATDPAIGGSMAGAIAALGGGEIIARLVAFGTTTLLARRLGPEGFGILGFASALCGYFALAVGGGLNDLASRDVAHNPGAAASIYRLVFAVRAPLALGALALLVGMAWVLPRPDTHRAVIALSGLSLVSLAIDPAWAIKALRRTGLAAVAMVGSQVVTLIGVTLLVLGPADVLRVPVLQFAGEATASLLLTLVALRAGSRLSPRWADGLALLRESVPLAFGRGMRVIIVSFDMVMLGILASDREVGFYAAVYRVHFFVLALVVAVQAAYLPVMARAAARGAEDLRLVSNQALAGAAVIGAPLVAGGLVTAGPLLGFFFGAPYAAGAAALQWLLVSLFFVFVHGLLHNVYVVTARTPLEARWFGAAAAINVLANLWLIPRYGIAGAAAATAIAEAVIAGGGVLVSGISGIGGVVAGWARPAAAALLMAAVVWSVGDTVHVVWRFALGAGVYGAAVLALDGPRTAVASLKLQLP
jgi:O-antigen/teichoic acid export membrane protein